MSNYIGLKIDVDTERGTRDGVPNLMRILDKYNICGTFLFALGPDNTGRALKRIFRPGFLSKVRRTKVASTYGLRTLGNGVLWPGPRIGKRHKSLIKSVYEAGHEVGIHCYDHIAWQDNLHKMNYEQIKKHVQRSVDIFHDIFGFMPQTMGAAGWQANADSLKAYDEVGTLTYASDTRGKKAFYPKVNGTTFKTLQLPTTMPTLDEVLGLRPFEQLHEHWDANLKEDLRIFTLHAEMEGGPYQKWFSELLQRWQGKGFQPTTCNKLILPDAPALPLDIKGTTPGRSGILAAQTY